MSASSSNTDNGAGSTGFGGSRPLFNSDGAIGKQFTSQGNLGAVGEKVGGPLASDGMIGKNFTDKGAIGGTINDTLGNDKKQ